MEVKIINKPSFCVAGKLGQGSSDSGPVWIKPLWEEANSKFNEINNLAKYDESGKIAGIWGLMSDINEQFKRWGTEGKYLAGCEVKDETTAPLGWTLWRVPNQTYVTISCTQDTYGEAFNYILNEYLPEKEYELIGAVHEYYPVDAEQGRLQLYFPIARD
jgi:predicted transcriptional regulator YdeE